MCLVWRYKSHSGVIYCDVVVGRRRQLNWLAVAVVAGETLCHLKSFSSFQIREIQSESYFQPETVFVSVIRFHSCPWTTMKRHSRATEMTKHRPKDYENQLGKYLEKNVPNIIKLFRLRLAECGCGEKWRLIDNARKCWRLINMKLKTLSIYHWDFQFSLWLLLWGSGWDDEWIQFEFFLKQSSL